MVVLMGVCAVFLRVCARCAVEAKAQGRSDEGHCMLMGILIMFAACFGFVILIQALDIYKAQTAPSVVLAEKAAELLKERR